MVFGLLGFQSQAHAYLDGQVMGYVSTRLMLEVGDLKIMSDTIFERP